MSTTQAGEVALSPALKGALATMRTRLVGRQIARVVPRLLAGGAAGALSAVVLLAWLPWLAFGSAWALWQPLSFAGVAAGALVELVRAMKGWRLPDATDCALALEMGRKDSDAVISTALAAAGTGAFGPALLGIAQVRAAEGGPLELPPAVASRWLVAGPLAALLALVAGLAAARLPLEVAAKPGAGAPAVSGRTASGAASSGSADDLKAFEQAMGLRREQASMKELASVLRDPRATAEERQAALEKARASQGGRSESLDQILPEKVPADVSAQEELARRVEQAAAAAGARARAAEEGRAGAAVDGSGGATGEAVRSAAVMEVAPAYNPRSFEGEGQTLAGQGAERRALAQSAVDALARIRQGK